MAYQQEKAIDSGILYGVVARGSCILASHCAKVGNFNDVAKDLLVKIDQQAGESRMTYRDGDYLYHYSRYHEECDQGIIILCMTDATFPRKDAFQFMEVLAKKLKEQFPYQLKSFSKAIPFSMNSEFEPVIGAEIKRANRNTQPDRKTKVNLNRTKKWLGGSYYMLF